jgi:uncharacterized protein (DUF362 family)
MQAVPPFSVVLSRCPSYARPELDQTLERVLSAVELPNLRSAKVLLKPNLISAKHGALPCTEAAFMLAAARWLLEHGAQVSLGDSPAFGTAAMVLQTLGIADQLTALGVEIRNFRQGRKARLPDGGWAVLAEAALDCDLLLNLPKVKAHAQARLTLAVKNCFGCVTGTRKAWWHIRYGGAAGEDFFNRLAQIPALLPPILSLADGISAMHKSGPINGEPYPLGLVAASANPVALDAALHQILNVAPERSPVMAACRRNGMPGTELAQLCFPLEKPAVLHADGFLVPEQLNPVRFNFFRFLISTARRLLMQRQGLKMQ